MLLIVTRKGPLMLCLGAGTHLLISLTRVRTPLIYPLLLCRTPGPVASVLIVSKVELEATGTLLLGKLQESRSLWILSLISLSSLLLLIRLRPPRKIIRSGILIR